MWVVQIALRRPYTFVVLSFLIAHFRRAGRASGRRPTSFPTSTFRSSASSGPTTACCRTTCPAASSIIMSATCPRRSATSSTSNPSRCNGYGVVKIFFQKGVNITDRAGAGHRGLADVLKLLPPGITPPYVLSYNASSVPILQLALSGNELPQMKMFDLGQNFIRPQLATVAGAAVPSPYGGKILQVQVDLDQQAMQAHNVSADDVVNAHLGAESDHAGRRRRRSASSTGTSRSTRARCCSSGSTTCRSRRSTAPSSTCATSPTCMRARRRKPTWSASTAARAVLMTILKAGAASTLERHRRRQIAVAAGRRRACRRA